MQIVLTHASARRAAVTSLVLVAGAFLPWSAKAQSGDGAKPPIIDVHVHVFGKPPMLPGAIQAAETLLGGFGVEKALLSHVPTNNDKKVMFKFRALAHFTRGKKRFGFLGGGGSLNPMIHRHDADSPEHAHLAKEFDTTARQIVAAGASGFGEMASLHISLTPGHAYTFQPADHPLFRRLADISAKSGLPIELHNDGVMGSMVVPDKFDHAENPGTFPGTIAGLTRLLEYNPRAKISWAHGGSDPLGLMTPAFIRGMMDRHKNLYMSLRIADSRSEKMGNLVWEGDTISDQWLSLLKRHPDRFFIGTDAMFIPEKLQAKKRHLKRFAEHNEQRYELTREFLAMLPADLAAKIAHKNARRVFRPKSQGQRMAARGTGGRQGGSGKGRKGNKKKPFPEAKILETVIGNTLSFDAPGSGRPLLVYFAQNGRVAMKVAGPGKRVVKKKWFIKDGKFLCRTFGRKNRNHCTQVGATPEPDTLLMFSKKVRYKAKVLKGKQLSNNLEVKK